MQARQMRGRRWPDEETIFVKRANVEVDFNVFVGLSGQLQAVRLSHVSLKCCDRRDVQAVTPGWRRWSNDVKRRGLDRRKSLSRPRRTAVTWRACVSVRSTAGIYHDLQTTDSRLRGDPLSGLPAFDAHTQKQQAAERFIRRLGETESSADQRWYFCHLCALLIKLVKGQEKKMYRSADAVVLRC